MTLQNLAGLFPRGYTNDWAVGHFNVHNHEFMRAVIDAAEAEQAPAILAIGMLSIKYMGLAPLFAAARNMATSSPVPLAIHLDHARDLATVKQALELGFTSVMFDGSYLSYEENVAQTRKVVTMAHAAGATAEGEIGILPPSMEQMDATTFTRPEQAAEFADTTGVDFLAVSLGSVHGMQTKGATLDLDLLSRLNESLRCPMVLHGASGVIDTDIRAAIGCGIRKVNVNTELKIAFKNRLRAAMATDEPIDLLTDLREGMDAVREACRNRIRTFGSNGEA